MSELELKSPITTELLNQTSTSGSTFEIYPVTEGLRSPRTIDAYHKSFNHFLNHIMIHDLQVLLDYNPKIIESFIIDYVRYLRDVKQLKHKSRICGAIFVKSF